MGQRKRQSIEIKAWVMRYLSNWEVAVDYFCPFEWLNFWVAILPGGNIQMNENDKFHVQISFCFCTIEREDKTRRNKFCSLLLQSTYCFYFILFTILTCLVLSIVISCFDFDQEVSKISEVKVGGWGKYLPTQLTPGAWVRTGLIGRCFFQPPTLTSDIFAAL